MIKSHYLITRFNLQHKKWRSVDKNGIPILTDEWMQHRFALFDKYTVPSVLKQTVQDFLWIVLFDYYTSERWMSRIHSYGKIFMPLYLTENWLDEFQKLLSVLANDWVATTRLDNDDAIDPKFMETIQGNLVTKRCFLNIPNGWIKYPYELPEPTDHRANPFMTYIEPATESRSIYFLPHGRNMRDHAPIIQISTKRLWTQIIHERNYVNE